MTYNRPFETDAAQRRGAAWRAAQRERLDVTGFIHMEKDPKFFNRADAHIDLSNDQMSEIERANVSASMMYATARFNAWYSACGFDSGTEMASARRQTLDHFLTEYREMLEENLDDYIQNFEKYMKTKSEHEKKDDV